MKDGIESGSISPETKRKELTPKSKSLSLPAFIVIKEYQHEAFLVETLHPTNPFVKRFAIDINHTKHLMDLVIKKEKLDDIEKTVFNLALDELNSPNTNTVPNVRTVLVDVFKRNEKTTTEFIIPRDKKTESTETHTICLWKKSANTIVVIDPSDSVYSSYLKKALESEYKKSNNLSVEIQRYTNKEFPKEDKFYQPSLIRSVGPEDGDSRDCIDIAVKIAFALTEALQSKIFIKIEEAIQVFNEVPTESNNYKYLMEKDKETLGASLGSLKNNINLIINSSINALSNQGSINNFLGKANNGTLIRELQSSNPQKREEVLTLLKETKGIGNTLGAADKLTVNTLEELRKLHILQVNQDSMFHKWKTTISGSILISKLENFILLQEKLKKFINEEYSKLNSEFPELKDFPSLELNIAVKNNVDLNLVANVAPLHEAVKSNDYHKVANLLTEFKEYTSYKVKNKEDADKAFKNFVGTVNENKETALHLAIYHRNEKISLMLIELMFPDDLIKASSFNNYTALHLAVQSDNTQIVLELLKALSGKDSLRQLVDSVDTYGQTALHWAVSAGNLEITKALLKEMTPEDIIKSAEGNRNYTALHLAVHSGNAQIVLELLKALSGKDALTQLVDAVDTYGQTALHWAAGRGNIEMTKALLEVMPPETIIKAAEGHRYYTALHLAVHSGNAQVVLELLNNLNDKNLLAQLVDTKDISGQTALHLAVVHFNIDITQLLLPLMKPENIIKSTGGDNNYTALHLAVLVSSLPVIEQLLNNFKGEPEQLLAFVNASDSYGQTALHLAVTRNLFTTDALLKRMDFEYINKSAEGNNNYTPLHLAVKKGEGLTVRLLLETLKSKSSSLEWYFKLDDFGNTVLNLAVESGNLEAVCILLESLKDNNKELLQLINVINVYGHTPLHLALYNENSQIAKILLEVLYDEPELHKLVDAIDNDENTALHLIVKTYCTDLKKFEEVRENFLKEQNPDILLKGGMQSLNSKITTFTQKNTELINLLLNKMTYDAIKRENLDFANDEIKKLITVKLQELKNEQETVTHQESYIPTNSTIEEDLNKTIQPAKNLNTDTSISDEQPNPLGEDNLVHQGEMTCLGQHSPH